MRSEWLALRHTSRSVRARHGRVAVAHGTDCKPQNGPQRNQNMVFDPVVSNAGQSGRRQYSRIHKVVTFGEGGMMDSGFIRATCRLVANPTTETCRWGRF